ncbi:MAG: hypothetical protein VX409_00795, partial [Verrucomicrobiota bacterium]|nr:hypothetical protein [Verrucomicrobiota bacterium]
MKFILSVITSCGFFCQCVALTKEVDPHNDPHEQVFRYAPMPKSTRSIIANLNGIQFAFDSQKLRTHTVWKGKLDLYGPQYTHSKRPFIAQANGRTLFENPPYLPWRSDNPSSKLNLDDSKLKGRFIGIRSNENEVSFSYQLTTKDKKKININLKPNATKQGLTRTLSVSPHDKTLWFLANSYKENFSQKFSLKSKSASLQTILTPLKYSELNITEAGSESTYESTNIDHTFKMYWIKIPPHKNTVTFQITNKFPSLVNTNSNKPKSKNIEFTNFQTRKSESSKFYLFEKLKLKKEWELMVTGMDWINDDKLAISTWTGDIYIISGLTNKKNITVSNLIKGLNEPMGLLQRDGKLYVSQKPELTEISFNKTRTSITLTQVSSDWGYSGHYNAFSYGPALDKNNNFVLANAGHSGRWDMKFMGWCIELGDNGSMSGISSGFREPNGIGNFGPNNDIFITDNQGHWTAACELNHLRPDKYFGRPSATPDPKKLYQGRNNFTPPAVWFPYSLARSVSGFTEIKDNNFGPFQGQLLVGDFQNALVTRVFLEKVNSEYQGAVFPFLKGFSSGVNRLTFGVDGNLYVGGLQRTWACVAPDPAALERVKFTGKTPFEISKVSANHDGFTLTFTQPVKTKSVNLENFDISQFKFAYHANYGSPRYSQNGEKGRQT